MTLFRALMFGTALALAVPAAAETTQTPEARAEATLQQMTQDQKLQLVFGYFSTDAPWMNFKLPAGGLPDSAGFIAGIPALGIPPQWQTDAGVGVATQRSPHPRERTALPSGIATAATWNRDLAFKGGAMIGHEARLSGFNVQLAGGVNLLRDPRNGRNFEYGGEDPYLAGIMVGEQIRGIQSNHIISTLKHYAFNDQSTSQSNLDSHIGDAAARSSDLLAFQFALETGDPGSVMCAYNIVHGDYACESPWLLTEVLKQDWGFKGYVMTDWGATHSTVKAANAGLDQQSGYPFGGKDYFAAPLAKAIASGEVPQARLDDMVRRVLYGLYANGLADDPVTGDQSAQIDYAADGAISQADAEESLVLLKNDGLLPLAGTAQSDIKTIAIIGGHADFGVLSGGGSSQVYAPGSHNFPGEGPSNFPGPLTYYASSPLKALQKRTPAAITYASGKDVKAAAALAAKSDIVIVFATQWAAEGMDQDGLSLPDKQDALIAAVAAANPKTVVVLETGGPVTMPWLDQVGAVVEAWFPGTSGGEAIARVLTGEVNPSGHLPVTFPAALDQLPRPVLDGDPKGGDRMYTVDYDIEGAAVGYKWFEKNGHKPLFPFGYGLSYTTFEMADLQPVDITPDGLIISFTVKNTGAVAGAEVAQVYVSGAGWEAPKRLGGFAKVQLAPGESQTGQVVIDPRLLATYDSARKTWTIAEGEYTVSLGADSQDVRQSFVVTLEHLVYDVRGKWIGK